MLKERRRVSIIFRRHSKMDVIKLIHKALSDEDIGTILGADANIIRYSEPSHISDLDELLTKDLDYCIILYERQTEQRPLDRFVKVQRHL